VNELGGAAGGALAEVTLLEEADGISARRRVHGDADARGPAADDRHVPGGAVLEETLKGGIAVHRIPHSPLYSGERVGVRGPFRWTMDVESWTLKRNGSTSNFQRSTFTAPHPCP